MLPKWRPPFAKGKSAEPRAQFSKSELKTIFVIVFSSQGQSMNSRKDADLRSVMQSREEALREVEKLVQHTEITTSRHLLLKRTFLTLFLRPIAMMVLF